MPARARCLIAILLLGFLAGGAAQESSGETEAQAEEKETPAAEEQAKTSPQGKSPDTFRPSEEISEDLSVSFPADI